MRRIFALGAVLALSCVIFLPTLRYSFVYDDYEQIVINPRLTAWSYLPGYFTTHLWAHSPLAAPNFYRPAFMIWLRLVYVSLGPPSWAWHLVSVLMHVAATACVFLLIRRLGGEFRSATLAAVLFGIHPIHTEAVAWISSVSEPLVTIFLVCSVYLYVVRKGPISFLSLLFATLAAFTKEVGILAPALILAYEGSRSRLKEGALGAAPYLLPVLLFLAMRINALGNAVSGVPPNMSVGEMVLTWPRVLLSYAVHLLWPVHLSVAYEIPAGTALWPLVLLIAVLAGLLWTLRHCSPNCRFGAAWTAITLLPALALRYLFVGDYVHDRYLYLPSAGLAIMAAAFLDRVRYTRPRTVAFSAIVVALCALTISNSKIWRDDISLFTRAVEMAPRNFIAKNNLADAYLKLNRTAEALPLLQQVIALRPDYGLGYYNLGRYYRQTGNYAEAERYFTISDQIAYIQQARLGRRR
jgi:tetratricopeptide (TPR) repeat protein